MDNTNEEVGSLNDVTNATFDARSQWYFIGSELGVDDDTLRALRGQFHDSPKECHQQMLSHRLNIGGLKWIHVVQALRSPSVGYSDLANRIAREHNLPEENIPIQIARPQAMPRPAENRMAPNQLLIPGIECCIGSNMRRCISWIIDWLVLLLVIWHLPTCWFTEAMTTQLGEGVINVFQDAVNGDIPEMTLLFIIFKSLVYHLIIAVVFETILLSLFSTTPGKWMMGLYVWSYSEPPSLTDTVPGYSIKVNRENPTFLQLVGRTLYKCFLRIFIGLPINVLYNYWTMDETGRTHYDKVSKTIVIRKKVN